MCSTSQHYSVVKTMKVGGISCKNGVIAREVSFYLIWWQMTHRLSHTGLFTVNYSMYREWVKIVTVKWSLACHDVTVVTTTMQYLVYTSPLLTTYLQPLTTPTHLHHRKERNTGRVALSPGYTQLTFLELSCVKIVLSVMSLDLNQVVQKRPCSCLRNRPNWLSYHSRSSVESSLD